MKHLIVGTAGHIDHGKTTLIRALTGRNTDRLKEEQERGISIELGFTYFDLPNGQRTGIIDVPGHEKFIRNMLAGVSGIDIVLLVVAADEGIMPQTLEHLAILDLIGVKNGFIVLTKSDMVDEEWLDMVKEEVIEEVKGTFLENTPVIPVSSVTRKGIDEVIAMIQKISDELLDKNVNDMPRLPIDRVFSISGFGTVVTGTLLAGKLSVGDEIEIFPQEIKARIRSLQVHDQDAKEAFGGQRVAINLAGIKKNEIRRGNVVAPVNSMQDTMMIDAKVKLLKSLDKPIENRTRLKLYLGTEEVLCRIILLDRDFLEPGDEAYVQLRLEEKTVAKMNDRFILRFYSPMFTIGGGEVLDPNPSKRKRFDEDAIEELVIKDEGDPKDVVEHIILSKGDSFLSIKELSMISSTHEDLFLESVDKLIDEGKVRLFKLSKDTYPVHMDKIDDLKVKIAEELRVFHGRFPLRIGYSKEEIRSKYFSSAKAKLAEEIISYLVESGFASQTKDLLSLPDFEVFLSDENKGYSDLIVDAFNKGEFNPPKKEDLLSLVMGKNKEIEEVFLFLVGSGEIIKINEDLYLLKSSLEQAKGVLIKLINENGSISVGEFRDVLNANRKVSIGLLEYFDGIKLTKRDGEKRVLI